VKEKRLRLCVEWGTFRALTCRTSGTSTWRRAKRTDVAQVSPPNGQHLVCSKDGAHIRQDARHFLYQPPRLEQQQRNGNTITLKQLTSNFQDPTSGLNIGHWFKAQQNRSVSSFSRGLGSLEELRDLEPSSFRRP
jgi:hypothetical protein